MNQVSYFGLSQKIFYNLIDYSLPDLNSNPMTIFPVSSTNSLENFYTENQYYIENIDTYQPNDVIIIYLDETFPPFLGQNVGVNQRFKCFLEIFYPICQFASERVIRISTDLFGQFPIMMF